MKATIFFELRDRRLDINREQQWVHRKIADIEKSVNVAAQQQPAIVAMFASCCVTVKVRRFQSCGQCRPGKGTVWARFGKQFGTECSLTDPGSRAHHRETTPNGTSNPPELGGGLNELDRPTVCGRLYRLIEITPPQRADAELRKGRITEATQCPAVKTALKIDPAGIMHRAVSDDFPLSAERLIKVTPAFVTTPFRLKVLSSLYVCAAAVRERAPV
jgi:hypothetical protein